MPGLLDFYGRAMRELLKGESNIDRDMSEQQILDDGFVRTRTPQKKVLVWPQGVA